MNRAELVKRYLELQREADALGIRSAHITKDMSNEEIIRLGKALKEKIATRRSNRGNCGAAPKKGNYNGNQWN